MSLVTDNSDIEMIYGFIEENAREDINKLLLRYHGKTLPYSLDFAVDQIVARRKTYSKLPYALENFFFRILFHLSRLPMNV